MKILIRTEKRKRALAFLLLITIVSEVLTPTASFALTGGPSQPEVEAFTPVNTSEMVDLSSGDFNYNIPLLDVGGYPINIAYNSGISMEQEASWVGLGWNLNVGAINRTLRGLPDDFNGDAITKEIKMKDNKTYGVNVGVGFELFGLKTKKIKSGKAKLSVGIGLTVNNYTGIGVELSASPGISAGEPSKGKLNASIGFKSSNSSGLTVSPNVSFSKRLSDIDKTDNTSTHGSIGIGLAMNSRSGLKDLSFNASLQGVKEKSTGEIDKLGGSFNSYAAVNFGASTYIPYINNSMINNSIALSIHIGAGAFGSDVDVTLSGFYSNQTIMDNTAVLPSYGYMYNHFGQNQTKALVDFNREKDNSFSRYTKNLPLSNLTYDVYSITGQGIGGSFRSFRGDVGYVYDNEARNLSDSYSVGGELSAGQTVDLGVDVSVVDVRTRTGKWINNNQAKDELSSKQNYYPDYEPSFFREVGERSENDATDNLYQNIGSDKPYRVKISGLVNHKAEKKLEAADNTTLNLNGKTKLTKRQKRNQVISHLTYSEAKKFALQKDIYDPTINPSSQMKVNSLFTRDHHVAEVTVLKTDGNRYVYGLPAYNNLQKEYTFNVSASINSSAPISKHPGYDNLTGYVGYSAKDLSLGNEKGVDNYYSSTKTPPYAHSYLLTSIISSDYVDLTGNGPSDDDYGNYTKFSYTKVPNYKWRFPFNKDKANFNENAKSMQNDDYGSVVYGEKELWFVDTIKTKNYIAIFELEDREDALPVLDENGGADTTKRSKYLKSIKLYSKPEFYADVTKDKINAVPIKVVNFVYDYSLCKGIPNHVSPGQGKLTLKAIYFTYGKSNRASLSKYEFEYSSASNFNYNPKAVDRWGNFKPIDNLPAAVGGNNSLIPPNANDYWYNSNITNSEFPYTDQLSKSEADVRSAAWNLSQIKLPSGGLININYESDDYAFVQNKAAMQMFKVIDVKNNKNIQSSEVGKANDIGKLYGGPTNTLYLDPNNLYIHVELNEVIPTDLTENEKKQYFLDHYLKDLLANDKFMNFRFLTNMTNSSNFSGNVGNYFEYVSGYAQLNTNPDNWGVQNAPGPNGKTMAYLKLESVKIDDKPGKIGNGIDFNPIAKAAMNQGRSRFNNLVWDASYSTPSDPVEAIKQLANESRGAASFSKKLIEAISGPNTSLATKQYCKEFIKEKSWIRLYSPKGKKLGGGSRVKSLTISDKWNTLTSGQTPSEYGQEYTYETEFDGDIISSGVAAYEPMLGGDENPFRKPVYMGPNRWTVLTPDERFFMEAPFGESFYPNPSITYSKVKVKNIYKNFNDKPKNGMVA